MPFYEVDLREIWVQTFRVEADSPEDAARAVRQGNGDPLDDRLEYSHTPDAQLDFEYDVRELGA